QQMSLLTAYESADFVSEEEKRTNRGIVVAGFTMGLATLGSYLFPPLLLPTIMGGIYLLVSLHRHSYHQLIDERKISLDQLGALYMTGMWLFGYYIFGSFACILYFTGVKIIHQMENRSRANLTNLFGQQPRFVWRLVDGVEIETPFSEIQRDDIIVVNAGEPLPVDGVVIQGLGSVDQHLLTGESQPVEKEVGDAVFAATLLLSGRLQIRVEQAGQNTLTAQIGQLLEQTVSHQTEIELKSQALADKTVLPNLAASLIALFVVGPVGAVATLGASIGFNIRLVSLLSTMNYLTIASKNNILIKDGRALERLKEIDTIVFDKTGTLTAGRMDIVSEHFFPEDLSEIQRNSLRSLARTLESRSGIQHPVVRAFEQNYGSISDATWNIEANTLQYVPGRGLRWSVSNDQRERMLDFLMPVSADQNQPYEAGISFREDAKRQRTDEADALETGQGPRAANVGLSDDPGTEVYLGSFQWTEILRDSDETDSPEGSPSSSTNVTSSEARLQTIQEQCSQEQRSAVVLSARIHGKLRTLAVFVLEDALRPGAKEMVQRLSRGFDLSILSGDSTEHVRRLAADLGIKTFLAQRTPEQKKQYLEELTSGKDLVLMVGDGINDSAALARADAGISFAGGAGLALHSSDILLLNNRLDDLLLMIAIARSTRRKILQNLGLAFAYNIALLPIAFAGWINPFLGAVFMSLSSITVIVNSIFAGRIRRKPSHPI
ncbi:MAG: cation-translocating P-type ATPase, partial [Leptospiraceae bacterium]|nr:cation-translocating P-type ATPase [Leptospiraceae bacterium]